MTKQKSTKRALISSLLILAMCFTMLAGTTFAWFTDSVTSGNNRILAGKLDVDLVMWNGTAYQSIADGRGDIFKEAAVAQNSTETLWEPNKTQIVYLGVKNLGNLWAKYRLYLDITDNGLADALEFAVIDGDQTAATFADWDDMKAAASSTGNLGTALAALQGTRIEAANQGSLAPNDGADYFALAIHMDKAAGNEYQEKDVYIDVALVATQDDVEEDAFDNTYDSNAELPQVAAPVYVSNATEFAAAITNAQDGDTITLTGNIELDAPLYVNKDVTIQGDGNTIISEQPIWASSDLTVKDVNFAYPTNASSNASMIYPAEGSDEIILDGCTFSNPQWEVVQVTSNTFKKLSITNCTFIADDVQGATSSYGNAPDECVRFIHVQPTPAANVSGVEITITGNTFKNCDKVKDSIVGIYYVEGTITIGGNTFEDFDADIVNGMSDKLSVHWPENGALKEVDLWTGAIATYAIY